MTALPGRRAPVLLAAALAVGPACAGGSAHPPAPEATPQQAALARILDATRAAGGVLLVHKGSHTETAAAGLARRRPAQPMRPNLRFRVGSVTKMFVATVSLQLDAEGALSLDDTVEHWLPGLVPGGERVTLRMLLSHTSGIPDYVLSPSVAGAEPTHRFAARELVRKAWDASPVTPPGRFSYSNTNYVLLGLVVQKATDHGIGQQIARRIARPLHLEDTVFPSGAALPGPHAHGYVSEGPYSAEPPRDATALDASVTGAAGALVSTAHDVDAFLRALVGGTLLPRYELRRMEAPGPGSEAGYGLGLAHARSKCGSLVGHEGELPGYATLAFTSPDASRSVVLLLNGQITSPDAGRAVERVLDAVLCTRPVPPSAGSTGLDGG